MGKQCSADGIPCPHVALHSPFGIKIQADVRVQLSSTKYRLRISSALYGFLQRILIGRYILSIKKK